MQISKVFNFLTNFLFQKIKSFTLKKLISFRNIGKKSHVIGHHI